jgi:NAD(P)-dependent dehydrogenase (short-subunit alcohol dehydrogenase family)
MNPFSLAGKTILITGASSGIGRQCAITCSQAGALVVLLGRDKERLQKTARQLEDASLCKTFLVDLTDAEEVNAFAKDISKDSILINGMIHAAGVSKTLPIRLSSFEKQELILRTNVMGPVNLTGNLVQKKGSMLDGGSIVFIASVMASVGEIGKTLYGMSKGALVAATKSMALELADRGIRVNTISPGVVKTPMSDNSAYSNDEESYGKVASLHPLGIGHPEDVANACIYLLSNASNWVTGTDLIVDGGYTAK